MYRTFSSSSPTAHPTALKYTPSCDSHPCNFDLSTRNTSGFSILCFRVPPQSAVIISCSCSGFNSRTSGTFVLPSLVRRETVAFYIVFLPVIGVNVVSSDPSRDASSDVSGLATLDSYSTSCNAYLRVSIWILSSVRSISPWLAIFVC